MMDNFKNINISLKYRSSSNDRFLGNQNDSHQFTHHRHQLQSSNKLLIKSKENSSNENLNKQLHKLEKSNSNSSKNNSMLNKDSKYNICYSSASSLFISNDSKSYGLSSDLKYDSKNDYNKNYKLKGKENLQENKSTSLIKSNLSKNNAIISSAQSALCESNNSSTMESVKYGELVVLGYNGCINSSSIKTTSLNDATRRKSKYILTRREKPNGVKPSTQHNCQSFQEVNNLMSRNRNHSVTYTMSRNHTVIVQYVRDEKTDMFQIGRSSENAIDFIVLDTVIPNSSSSSCHIGSLLPSSQSKQSSQDQFKSQQSTFQQSTISRFSCRICVDREYPYTARIYAAGFDSSNNIFLGEKATKWKNDKGEIDGVTTNGVLIMHPTDGFTSENSKTNEWMEVSVCGSVFSLNESRLTPCLVKNNTQKESSIRSNILQDGTLIDLCGATLMWRSAEGLNRTPTKRYLDMNLENLNRLRPQCPVGLKTLIFPSTASPILNTNQSYLFPNLNNLYINDGCYFLNKHTKHSKDRIPMVYLKCGHVHGHHEWGVKKDNERECPLCRNVGAYVQLEVGIEPSFYNDTNLTLFKPYAFRPCGHMASESTCKYWSKILIPQGTTQALSSICPFCAIPLSKEQPFVKLIFQEGV